MKHFGYFFLSLIPLALLPTLAGAQLRPASTFLEGLEGASSRRIDPALGREIVGFFGPPVESKTRAELLALLLEATWEEVNGRHTLRRSTEQKRAVKERDDRARLSAFEAWQEKQRQTQKNRISPTERARVLQNTFEAAFQARRDPQRSGSAMEDLQRLGGAHAYLRGILLTLPAGEVVRAAQNAPVYLSDRPNAAEKPLPASTAQLASEYEDFRDAVRASTETISSSDVSRVQYWRETFGTSTSALRYDKALVTFRPFGRRVFAHLATLSDTGALLDQAVEIVDVDATRRTVTPSQETLLKRLGDETIPPSPEAKSFLTNGRTTSPSEAAAYLREFEANEPLGLAFDQFLEMASRRWQKPVVARLPDAALTILARTATRDSGLDAETVRSLIVEGAIEIEETPNAILIRPQNTAAAEFHRLDRKAARAFVGNWAKRGFDLWGLATYHAEAGLPATGSLSESLKHCLQTAAEVRVSHSLPHFALAFIGRLPSNEYQRLLTGGALRANAMNSEQRALLWAWAALRGEREPGTTIHVTDLALNAPELLPTGLSSGTQASLSSVDVPVFRIASEGRSELLSGFPNIPTDARSAAMTIVGSYGAEAAKDPLEYIDGTYFETNRRTVTLIVRLADGVVLQGTYENPVSFPPSAIGRKARDLSPRFQQILIETAQAAVKGQR